MSVRPDQVTRVDGNIPDVDVLTIDGGVNASASHWVRRRHLSGDRALFSNVGWVSLNLSLRHISSRSLLLFRFSVFFTFPTSLIFIILLAFPFLIGPDTLPPFEFHDAGPGPHPHDHGLFRV
jgi:hypothetical protein